MANFSEQADFTEGVSDKLRTQGELTPSSTSCPTEGEGAINYFFPVEIVIAGSVAPREREAIQAQIYQDLHDAIVRRLA